MLNHTENSKKNISRRDFFKGATIGTAALAGISLLAGCGGSGGASCGMPESWDFEADVVVVGFGGAGSGAAQEAHDAGAEVIILEKMPEEQAGGDSTCFGGVMSEVGATQMIGMAFGQMDMDYANTLADKTAEFIPWLMENGVEFIEGTGIAKDAGPGVYAALKKAVVDREINVMYSTPATALVQDGETKEIRGVRAEKDGAEIYVKARKGVVITSGGYHANEAMVNTLNFPGSKMVTAGSPANTGEGLMMALAAGAKLSNVAMGLEFCEVAYRKASEEIGTCVTNQRWSALDWFTGEDSDYLHPSDIFVNAAGQRFMNERMMVTHEKSQLALYDFAGGLFDNPKGYKNQPFFMICDDDCVKSGPLASRTNNWSWASVKSLYQWSEDNQEEIEKGWLVKADTLEELAESITGTDWWGNEVAIDPEGLKATVEAYNATCEAGEDPYGRPANKLQPIAKAPFYAVELVSCSLYTLGGLISDVNGRTIGNDGEPIGRLYSAGNVGQPVVLSPYGIAGCVSHGRLAGRDAAALENWG